MKPADPILVNANTSWYIKRFYSELMHTLVEEGHRVIALVPENDHSLESLGIEVLVLPMNRSGVRINQEVAYFVRLFKLIKRNRPSVILNFTVKPNIYGGIVAATIGVPAINTISGIGSALVNPGYISKVVKFLYALASKFSTNVFLNDQDAKLFLKVGIHARRNVVAPGAGVNVNDFTREGSTVSDNSFVYLGRLIKDKGIEEYLEAATRLKGSGATFLVFGEVDLDNPSSLQLNDVLDFHDKGIISYMGFTEDVRETLQNVDCLVLPSYSEGLSRVMMEAASMRVGLIASNVPGCKELVTTNAGILVESKSSDDLVKGLREYMSMSIPEKDSFKERSHLHIAKNFSVTLVVNLYLELLENQCG